MVPALVGFCSYFVFSDVAWDYFKATEDSEWMIILRWIALYCQRFFRCLMMPAFFFAMWGRWSRWYSVVSLASEMPFYCIWQAGIGEVITYPLKSSHFRGGSELSDRVSQGALQSQYIVLAFLSFEMILQCYIWCKSTKGILTSRLCAPASHRVKFLFVYAGVSGVWSLLDFIFTLSTSQETAEGTSTKGFVWPPDEGDCNKVPLLLSSLVRLTGAVYALISGLRFSTKLSQRKELGSVVPNLVASLDSTYRWLLVGQLVELASGALQQWRTFPLARSLGKEGVNSWTITTTSFTEAPFGYRLCLMQNFMLSNNLCMAIYLALLFALSVAWRLQADRENYQDKVAHDQLLQRQLDELEEEGPIELRTPICKPPVLCASDEEWLKWIQDTNAGIMSLTKTLGPSEGGAAAIGIAKQVRHLWSES